MQYLVGDCRQVEEEYTDVRLDVFVLIDILNESSTILYHSAEEVETLAVVVVCQNVVPRRALN